MNIKTVHVSQSPVTPHFVVVQVPDRIRIHVRRRIDESMERAVFEEALREFEAAQACGIRGAILLSASSFLAGSGDASEGATQTSITSLGDLLARLAGFCRHHADGGAMSAGGERLVSEAESYAALLKGES